MNPRSSYVLAHPFVIDGKRATCPVGHDRLGYDEHQPRGLASPTVLFCTKCLRWFSTVEIRYHNLVEWIPITEDEAGRTKP